LDGKVISVVQKSKISMSTSSVEENGANNTPESYCKSNSQAHVQHTQKRLNESFVVVQVVLTNLEGT